MPGLRGIVPHQAQVIGRDDKGKCIARVDTPEGRTNSMATTVIANDIIGKHGKSYIPKNQPVNLYRRLLLRQKIAFTVDEMTLDQAFQRGFLIHKPFEGHRHCTVFSFGDSRA